MVDPVDVAFVVVVVVVTGLAVEDEASVLATAEVEIARVAVVAIIGVLEVVEVALVAVVSTTFVVDAIVFAGVEDDLAVVRPMVVVVWLVVVA